MSESFAELFEESLNQTEMSAGNVVIGTIADIADGYVIVSAGLKSEGIIPVAQFTNLQGELEVNIGDEVEVVLEAVEDGYGETRLSREKAKRAKAWITLEKSFEAEEIITGIITGKVKGGFTVELGDIRAFLPGSLVDVRPVRDTAYLENKDLEFKIIKLDQKRNNVVVSRRAVVENEYSEEREALLNSIEEGKPIKGVVKNLTDYGAFLDLGGIDGLLHITDMAWKRVRHPSEIVEVGSEIEVMVLKFDKEKTRVSLGLKQLGDDPWAEIARRYPEGSRLFGKVATSLITVV
ncbi:SSU ribosomal protein S1p, partial [hydrothermal vent metagenome]